jgi:hypothetical protein
MLFSMMIVCGHGRVGKEDCGFGSALCCGVLCRAVPALVSTGFGRCDVREDRRKARQGERERKRGKRESRGGRAGWTSSVRKKR